MKLRLFGRQTRFRQAFTLPEVLVTVSISAAVGLIMYSLLNSGLILFSQNSGVNTSGMRAREAIDRLNSLVRYAEETPQIITTTGAPAAGTTGPGIIVKRYLGGPYIIKESGGTTGDIAATATSFQVEYSPEIFADAPQVGDYLLLEIPVRPELQIASVTSLSDITVNGKTIKRVRITTTLAIGESARPSAYRVAGYLQRREAFIFTTVNSKTELRYFPRVVAVAAGSEFPSVLSYQVMKGGYEVLTTQPYFQLATDGALAVRMQIHATGQTEYVELLAGKRTLTTLPVRATIRNIRR